MIIEVDVDDEAWSVLPEASDLLTRAADATFARLAPTHGDKVLSMSLTTDDEVAELNHLWRDKSGPTNVLSFPANPDMPLPPGEPRPLGDVILAAGVVGTEAAKQNKALADHTVHLAVHGILHIMGYDHLTDTQAEEMEALEISILEGLGIANPYV